jgi:hypothetical protein
MLNTFFSHARLPPKAARIKKTDNLLETQTAQTKAFKMQYAYNQLFMQANIPQTTKL